MPASTTAASRLTVSGIRKRFGDVHALRDASFEVRAGEVLGLIGPNGAGKSTLMECLAGLIPSDAGEVHSDGRTIPPAARREHLLYLPDGIAPWPDQRAAWILDFACAVYGSAEPVDSDLARVLRLDELRDHQLGTLSKGQRKRVLLGLALLTPQPIVLMDEPFDGLDLRQTRETIALFRRLAESGRSLVVSIHSMSDATRVCDRLVLLSDGRAIAEGTLDELRARAGLPNADLEEVFLALA